MDESSGQVFSNVQVEPVQPSDYRAVEFMPVAGRFRRYALISTLLVWVPALIVVSLAQWLPAIPFYPGMIVVAGVALVGAMIAVYRQLDAGRRGWALREQDLIARSGVLWRSITALPIARIQHVETSHGPLERSLGLARLKVFTAGGVTADLVVIGLERDQADSLREHLVEQIRLRDGGSEQAGSGGA